MKIFKLIVIIICFSQVSKSFGQNADSIRFFQPCSEALFIIPEKWPHFPEGDEMLLEKLSKVKVDKKLSQEIRILVRVNCKGEAMDFRLFKKEKATPLEKEVFGIVSSEKTWIPATNGSINVNVYYILHLEVKKGKLKIKYTNTGTTIKWNDPHYKDNI